MYNLLKILETIIKAYSHLPIKQLFDNYLQVSIFVISNLHLAKQIVKTSFKQISKAKEEIFFKSNFLDFQNQHGNFLTKKSEKQNYIFVSVSHPKLLPLQKYIFGKVGQKISSNHMIQKVICLTKDNQIIDNIFSVDQNLSKNQKVLIKGFFVQIPSDYGSLEQVINHVALYLSICELFHSHIALVLSINEIKDYNEFENLEKLIQKDFAEDDDQLLTISAYSRIFEALPFKITYEEMAHLAQIQPYYWGQIVRVSEGTEGIIFWFLLNNLPILSNQRKFHEEKQSKQFLLLNSHRNICEKAGLKICAEQYGHIIMKSNALVKKPLEELDLTVVIFNIKKSQYWENIDNFFSPIFESEIKQFTQRKIKSRDFRTCVKINKQIDRLSQLLCEIPDILSNTNSSEKKKEAQELTWTINQTLFLKNKS